MFDLTNADQNALQNAVRAAESKLPESVNDPLLLYKAKVGNGTWTLGQELNDVTGQTALINAGSIARGYVAFERGTNRKLGEEMAPLFSNETASSQPLSHLPNAAVREQTTARVFLPDMELQAAFKGSTVGVDQAATVVINQILSRMRAGETVYLHPLVKLGTSTYKHKEYGPTNQPSMQVVAWCDVAGNKQEEKQTLGNRL